MGGGMGGGMGGRGGFPVDKAGGNPFGDSRSGGGAGGLSRYAGGRSTNQTSSGYGATKATPFGKQSVQKPTISKGPTIGKTSSTMNTGGVRISGNGLRASQLDPMRTSKTDGFGAKPSFGGAKP